MTRVIQHYHSTLDIVALKCFESVSEVLPLSSHDSLGEHSFRAYPLSVEAGQGPYLWRLSVEMTVRNIRGSSLSQCHSAFNPACSKHYDIYFENKKIEDSVPTNKVFNLF